MVALAYDGLCTFEFGVAAEIFGLDRSEMGSAWYRFRVAAVEPVPEAREGGRLGRALERMRADPAGDTTIAKLARTEGMSRRTFLRPFKASTGTTPGIWLANARVARARELLKYSAYDIEQIACAAGFGSAADRHRRWQAIRVSTSGWPRLLFSFA